MEDSDRLDLEVLQFVGVLRKFVGAKKTPKNHSSKLQLLALKWAECEHFQGCFFYETQIDVYTNYNPLTYIKSSCKVNVTG